LNIAPPYGRLQYVLLVPSVVRSNAPQTACVQLHNLSEPLSVSAVLEYGSVQKTLFEEPMTQNDFFKCIKLTQFRTPISEKKIFFPCFLYSTSLFLGGSVYWQRENKPPAERFSDFYSRAPSAEIEMTSYVLLALLNRTKHTPEELSYISRIVYWLIKQQNPYGGFSSTQDTVVALQALAHYGSLTFSKKSLNTVEVHSMETPSKIFQVNDKNRFLLQQASLPTIPGSYSVEVNGSGCVYLQTTLRYNIHLPKKAAGFSLSVRTENVSCTGNYPPKFDLVLSASYTGNRNVSNMAIIDVKMLSGFIPEESSLKKLRYENSVVDRVDIKNNHILFYLQKVSQKEISFSFSVEQSLPVSDIKPVPVHIYDYYETDEYALSEYNTPCSPSSN
uniref:Alpha-macroglobulin receptor-binding domain-containing protein n=1 Tax=Zosterops lateralis melanops TaxID=1220523 RepID=A0A8D2P4J6_ZOSLA